mmetsp:Transcript_60996/g.149357  ORF Transcript_60996/g.149357 Transcript_60996/m.149357 type:complete len:373 (-) Transcript_60996:32-1150(-)
MTILSKWRIGYLWIATYCFMCNDSFILRRWQHAVSVDALNTNPTLSSSRRRFVINTVGGALLTSSSSVVSSSAVANAAPPITTKETDSLLAITRRKLRKKPPKILRRKLSQDFAVLLMRSSYNALDELDCVGMDQFQRDFFLIRSSEYEAYTKALGDGLVKQGDLTDPYYFDFISYAQYRTIDRELTTDPLMVFEEMQQVDAERAARESIPGTFVPVVIKRDPALTDSMLVPTHSSRVGAAILDRLIENFDGTESKIPHMDVLFGPADVDPAILLKALQQLVNLFLIGGFAFGADVSMEQSSTGSARGTKYTITLNAPATLWGGNVLQQEGAAVNNSFVLKTVTEFLKRSGSMCSSTTRYDGTKEIITITLI